MVYDVFCDWLQRFISSGYKCDVKTFLFFFFKKEEEEEWGISSEVF